MSEWVCLDCLADPCTTQSHAWAEATRITHEDGSDAWFVGPDNEDPNADDAFDGWLT